MAAAQDPSSQAYIAYVTEKGFPPKNASQLVNFAKFHDPPFIGVKYSTARNVVADPPEIDSNKDDPYQQNANGTIDTKEAKPQQLQQDNNQNTGNSKIEEVKHPELKQPPPPPPPQEQEQSVIKQKPKPQAPPLSNPYVDSSIAQNFMTAVDNQNFVQKHDNVPKKSKVANAYDLFKKNMGSKPKNTIQFLGFVEKNNLDLTYSECSQYIQYMKKYEDDDSDNEQTGAGYSNYGV